jgi:hypothetical protein
LAFTVVSLIAADATGTWTGTLTDTTKSPTMTLKANSPRNCSNGQNENAASGTLPRRLMPITFEKPDI